MERVARIAKWAEMHSTWGTLALACLIGLSSLLILLGVITSAQSRLASLHGDMMYSLLLSRDLFIDHYEISGWWLVPGPHFFPDLAIVIALYAALPDMGYACTLYSVVYFAMLLLLFVGIFLNVNRNKRTCALGVFGVGVFFIALLQDPSYLNLSRWLLFPTLHGGPMLMGLALVLVFLKATREGYTWWLASALFFAAFLGMLSNKLIVPQFIVPLLLTASVFCFFRMVKLRDIVTTALVIAAGYAANLAVLEVLGWTAFLHVPPWARTFPVADLAAIVSSWRNLADSLPSQFRETFLVWLTLPAWLIASIFVLVRYRRSMIERSICSLGDSQSSGSILFLVVLSLLSVAGTVTAPILTGRYRGGYCMGYMLPLFLLPSFILAALMVFFSRKGLSALGGFGLSAVLIFGLYRIAPATASLDTGRLKLPYPGYVEWLDSLAVSRGLKYGYGSFWRSRCFTVLSRAGVRVNDVEGTDTSPSYLRWMANPRWYLGKDGQEYPKYTFIIPDYLWKEKILEKFGQPAYSESTVDGDAHFEIWVYDRPEDIAFRNYVRLEAMIAFGQQPYSPVTFPSNLSTFKENGTAWDAERNSVIPENGRLHVGVRSLAGLEIMEIAADGNDEYRVSFFQGDKLLARVDVPKAPGPGIQERQIRLPEGVASKGFSELTIEAISGDGRYSVGHIFFYEDTYAQ